MIMLFLLAITLLAILLSVFCRKSLQAVEAINVISAIGEFGVGAYILWEIIQQRTYTFLPYLSLNSLSTLVLFLTIIVGLVATCHSIGYFREELLKQTVMKEKVQLSYILMRTFILCMYVATMTANPIIMWLSIEAITLTTVFLINFFNRPEDIEAAWKFLIINSIGLLFGLLGTLLFLSQGAVIGKLFVQWTDLIAVAPQMKASVIKFAYIFVFLGYGTKMGFVPMHTWKPDTYNKAPMPIVALLSGALLNVALLAILRFAFITNSVVGSSFSNSLFIFFGILSILVAGSIIYTQKNYKRLLAYSTIENGGFIMLGLGFGGIGIFGALLQMIYHSLVKSLLFLLSSNVAVRYSSSLVEQVKGMLKVLPMTSILFIFAFLFVTGLPPFGMFFSELYIFLGGFSHNIIVVALALIMAIFVFVGFFRSTVTMTFGTPPEDIKQGEKNLWTLIPVAALAVLLVVLSIFMPPLVTQLIRESIKIILP